MIKLDDVTLPDMPSDADLATHPYAYITNDNGVYRLALSTKPLYYYWLHNAYKFAEDCQIIWYYYTDSLGGWKYNGIQEISVQTFKLQGIIVWNNYDILVSETGEVDRYASTSGDTFDVTTLVKQSILDEYPKCVILTKEESNGTNIFVCYSDKPLYLDEEETTVRRISGTLGVVESYLRTSDGELLVQGTKTLYEVFPAVLYTKKYDINKDGVLDKADSEAIHNHFMGSATITDVETLENADMNKDGVIDTTDAALLHNIIESGEGSGFAIAWSNYTLDVLYKIFKGTLTNIADSIRAKTGKTDKVPPEIMPEEIESISDGATMEDFEEAFLGGEW